LSLDWGFSRPLPPNTSDVPSIQRDIQPHTPPLEKTSTVVVDSLTITDGEKTRCYLTMNKNSYRLIHVIKIHIPTGPEEFKSGKKKIKF
jgi:hypothetical protein